MQGVQLYWRIEASSYIENHQKKDIWDFNGAKDARVCRPN
jgi:hypothetical protein